LSYSNGLLALEWATPDGCPRSGDYIPGQGEDGGNDTGSWGFFGFIKFLFWAVVFGLIMYFAIGKFIPYLIYT